MLKRSGGKQGQPGRSLVLSDGKRAIVIARAHTRW